MCLAAVLGLSLVVGCAGREPSPEEEALTALEKGKEFQDRGNMQRAGDWYTYALQSDPQLAEAYVGRGYVFLAFDNLQGALDDLAAATSIDPELATAYYYRGLVYAGLEASNKAILNFAKAIELDPYGRGLLRPGVVQPSVRGTRGGYRGHVGGDRSAAYGPEVLHGAGAAVPDDRGEGACRG